MKAGEKHLLDFIGSAFQVMVPIYQRNYSWTHGECEQLWDDIIRAGSKQEASSAPPHFLGSIVYISQGTQLATDQKWLIIDGQQRLATVTLLLAALAESLDEQKPPSGLSANKLRNRYLINQDEDGDLRNKLILSRTGKDTLISIVNQDPLPKEYSVRIKENHEWLQKQIKEQNDLGIIRRGLEKLMIVEIALTQGQDNPQLIFESMNSTGRKLSHADLIRNFMLLGLKPSHQEQLYKNYWLRMEQDFGQEAYDEDFDKFIRHYLTAKTKAIPAFWYIYDAFKEYSKKVDGDPDALLKNLNESTRDYCAMAYDRERNPSLKAAFRDLADLKADVAYPLLLELYHDCREGRLEASELLNAVRLIESYVFRRHVCEIPTNSMNKTFATFAKVLDKEHYLESMQAHFLLMDGNRRFPDDSEFKEKIQKRDLYRGKTSYWLRCIENSRRKEPVAFENLTIEHIMPKNARASEAWRKELGEDWERVYQAYLNTIGNLTLTAYNPKYSDRPFQEKRDMPDIGLRYSPLHLNKGMGEQDAWNEDAIVSRAHNLAEQAIEIWQAPNLSDETLENYKQASKAAISDVMCQ